MEIEQILNELDSTATGYRREALDAAVAQNEAITPRLLELLDAVLGDPESYAAKDLPGLAYAIVLLTHFSEPAAHARLLALGRLRSDVLERLIGEMITETLPSPCGAPAGETSRGFDHLLPMPTLSTWFERAVPGLSPMQRPLVFGSVKRPWPSSMSNSLKILRRNGRMRALPPLWPAFTPASTSRA